MPDWAPFAIAAIGGYLFGSVPFGLVLTRAAGLGDIRAVGSGNIGATNVLRTGRRDLALATLVLDSLKAGLAFQLFETIWWHNIGLVAGAAAFIGHCYPIWLGFRGGKGVATYAGLMIFASPPGFFVGVVTWPGTFALTRISSLAALVSAALIPIGAWILGESDFAVAIITALSALMFWRHRANIVRLLNGAEPRFGEKKA